MKKDDKKKKSDTVGEEILEEKVIVKRRKFLAGITTGAAAAGMASGGKWVKPVVDNVVLPAHAQTSGKGDMTIEGRVGRIGDADEFEAYEGRTFTDGSYPITADGGVDYDNFQADFAALFRPVQSQSVSVNLDVNVDGTGGNEFNVDGALSQTSSANVPTEDAMRASFNPINVDSDDTTTMTVVGTIRADGYATRRITYVIT